MNIDFEYQLFKDDWSFHAQKYRKLCQELEWLFFFMGEDDQVLSSDVEYSCKYLEKCHAYTGKKVGLVPLRENAAPFWGSLENIEKEKRLNSKITSFNISKNLGLLPHGSALITNTAELNECDLEKGILKSPFEFSGRGFSKNKTQKVTFPVIYEPWEKRTSDFGVFMNLESGQSRAIRSHVDHKGQFKGGRIMTEDEFTETFDQAVLEEICDEYRNLGADDFIQMDCYSTDKGMRYLVEVNHRKTLGDFIYKLDDFTEWEDFLVLLLNERESSKLLSNYGGEYEILSPEGHFFSCFILKDKNPSIIKEIIKVN